MKRGGPTVIHVSTKTAEVDPVYFPDIEVIGDIANAVWQMKEDIVPNGGWKFDHMLAYRQAEVDHTQPLSQDARFPIFPPHLVQSVRDAMPDDGIICLDNGVSKIWFARGYTATRDRKSVVSVTRVSVRVDRGGRLTIKQKKHP